MGSTSADDVLHGRALAEKQTRLYELLIVCDSAIVAFSGGVDSSYLAWAAALTLGARSLCITADSPRYPDRHRQLACRFAREFGLRHEIVHTRGLDGPEYRASPVAP